VGVPWDVEGPPVGPARPRLRFDDDDEDANDEDGNAEDDDAIFVRLSAQLCYVRHNTQHAVTVRVKSSNRRGEK
jgi:hypothetical protein